MVNYTPTEAGKHDINISCDDEPVGGSPWKVNAIQGSDPRKVRAFGPGLEKGILDEPNEFTITTKNAGQGGLGLAIEGPSEAKMTCKDNRDGSCTVEYIPTVQGDYDVNIKFDEMNIPGSPFRVPVKDEKTWLMDPKLSEGDIPKGNIQVNLIKARNLIKTDIIGKSDPYAILTYGGQSFKTDTIKNTQEPEWNCQVDFKVPDGNDDAIKITTVSYTHLTLPTKA